MVDAMITFSSTQQVGGDWVTDRGDVIVDSGVVIEKRREDAHIGGADDVELELGRGTVRREGAWWKSGC